MRGRLYPWGVVELENDEHCDYLKLRTMLISHMQDLQEVTHDLHYENYRATRLADGSDGEAAGINQQLKFSQVPQSDNHAPRNNAKDIQLREKEAELARMQQMLEQMQLQLKQQQKGPSTHQL